MKHPKLNNFGQFPCNEMPIYRAEEIIHSFAEIDEDVLLASPEPECEETDYETEASKSTGDADSESKADVVRHGKTNAENVALLLLDDSNIAKSQNDSNGNEGNTASERISEELCSENVAEQRTASESTNYNERVGRMSEVNAEIMEIDIVHKIVDNGKGIGSYNEPADGIGRSRLNVAAEHDKDSQTEVPEICETDDNAIVNHSTAVTQDASNNITEIEHATNGVSTENLDKSKVGADSEAVGAGDSVNLIAAVNVASAEGESNDEEIELSENDDALNAALGGGDSDEENVATGAAKASTSRGEKRMRETFDSNRVDCINVQCPSGAELCPSPVAVMTYYGVRRDKNLLQRVCKACALVAERHYRKLIDMAKNSIPILHADFPRPTNDIVIMDKVEEICDNEDCIPDDEVDMIEDNIDDIATDTMETLYLDFQLKESTQILEKKIDKLTDSVAEVYELYNSWERELRKWRNMVYENYTPQIKELKPIDASDPHEVHQRLLPLSKCRVRFEAPKKRMPQCTLPPAVVVPSEGQEIVPLGEISNTCLARCEGIVTYQPLKKGMPVYILKGLSHGPWYRGYIYEVVRRPNWAPESVNLPKRLAGNCGLYSVKFEDPRHGLASVVPGKNLAYTTPSEYAYSISTRIIARLPNPDDPQSNDVYYVGIIAEPEKQLNRHRYLVFFEHGFAQYVTHDKILPVCEVSLNVCDDMYEECRKFVVQYLNKYPERPMVKLQVGQCVRTECNGKWLPAKVLQVDASMAQMQFDSPNRKEWIYRGSTRLKPLYSELVQKHRSLGTSFLKKRNRPYVEYNMDPGTDDKNAVRNVAKKRTGAPVSAPVSPPVDAPVSAPVDAEQATNTKLHTYKSVTNLPPKMLEQMEYPTNGYVQKIHLTNRIRNRPFVIHRCGPSCVTWTGYAELRRKNRDTAPLVFPLTVGYSRIILKPKGKRMVAYVSPCGRALRSLPELRLYLQTTENELGVDSFDFDHWVRVMDEFRLDRHMYKTYVEDISGGAESMAVSCVNEVAEVWPQVMKYLTERLPQKGVHLNKDPAFMVCCDCEDDCSKKENCACWKLTIAGTAQGPEGVIDQSVGYQFKRLPEAVTTGIYECHSGCRCKNTCLNRVVQHPISQKLQLFRTLHKGWGVRTLTDIPMGAFICIYVGRLNTEAAANKDGHMYGDEYLAELDYIEIVQNFKDGFESDVEKDENESDEEIGNEAEERKQRQADREYVPDVFVGEGDSRATRNTRARRRAVENECIDVEDEAMDLPTTPSNFNANVDDEEESGKRRHGKSVREMLGDGPEEVYIMDAKVEGNLGRYLNHSCQPNVFVQNVFVDTHDIRFPWITFFALAHIRAGTELTWDYNYKVGSVPNKLLYCYCGTPDCRGRLI